MLCHDRWAWNGNAPWNSYLQEASELAMDLKLVSDANVQYYAGSDGFA